MDDRARAAIGRRLATLYGRESADAVLGELEARVESIFAELGRPGPRRPLDERDAVLITYADQVRDAGRAPLATLRELLRAEELDELIDTVHLLPFFPYTSDDGFSVSDYEAVDAGAGSWDDVAALGAQHDLMFDLVLNHCSASHRWFEGYLRGEPGLEDFFIEADPDADLSAVVRPRTLPLLTPFETSRGLRHVWTTFSADQVDLNYAEPRVLLEMLSVLAGYLARGARIVRLDAVAYLWKTPGTGCIHLPETHEVVKLMRDLAEALAPGTIILTETNVPHEENVSYLGDGDEAQMVYQFALPPLLLDAVVHRDPGPLREWLERLEPAPPGTAFFNFTASHDGVGLRPLEGLVDEQRLASLTEAVRGRGALVSERASPQGGTRPYELNVSYFDAVGEAADSGKPIGVEEHVARFLATQALMLALRGVPGIYFHSLVGTPNDLEGYRASGERRRINRRRYGLGELRELLASPDSPRRMVLEGYRLMLRARRSTTAFDPAAAQRPVDAGDGALVAFERAGRDGERVLVVGNFGRGAASLDCTSLAGGGWRSDLLSGRAVGADGRFELAGLRVAWLTAAPGGARREPLSSPP